MEAYIVPIPRGTIAFLKSAFKLGLTTSPLLLIYNFYILYYYWTVGDVSIVEATPSVAAPQSYLSWAITAPFNLAYDYAYTIIETASVYANFLKGDPLVFADDDIYSLRTTIDTIDLTEPVAVTSVVDFIAHSDKFNVTVHAGLEEMLNDTIAFIPGMSLFLKSDEFSPSALLRNGLATLSKAYKSPIATNNGDMSTADATSTSYTFSAANGSLEREHVLKWLSVPEMQPLYDDLAIVLAQEGDKGDSEVKTSREDDVAAAATNTSATATTSSEAKHPSPVLLWDLMHLQHARAHAHALSLAPTTDTVESADYVAAKDAAQRILSSLSNMAMDRGEDALPLSPSGFTMHTVDILQSAKSEGIKIPENIQYTEYTYLDVGFVVVTLLRCIISPLQILIRIYLLTQLRWIEHLPVEDIRVVLLQLNSGWAFQVHHLIGLVLMKMTYALIGLVLVRLFCPIALSSLYYSALMALVVHFVVMAKAMMVMQLAIEGEYDPEIADEATTRVLGEVAAAGRMSAEEVKRCTVVCDAHVARMCEHVVANDTCAICMCDFELGRFAEMEGDSNSNSNGSGDGSVSSMGSINAMDSNAEANDSGSGNSDSDATGKCEIVRVLGCGHYFHLQCVDHWLMKNKSICPTCRESALHSDETVTKLRQDIRDATAARRQTQIQKVISDLARAYAVQTSAVVDRVVADSEEGDEKDEFKATDNVLRHRMTNAVYTSPLATSITASAANVTQEALTSSSETMYSSTSMGQAEKKYSAMPEHMDEEEEDDLEPLDAVFDSIFNTNTYNAPQEKENTIEATNNLASPQSIMATEEDNEWLRNFADGDDDGPNDIAADFNAIVESFARRNKVKTEQGKEDCDEVTMQPDEILELIEEMEKFSPGN